MTARSPQVAWKLWLEFRRLNLPIHDLTAVDLARAFRFAAGQGWARGTLNAPVSSDEPDANDVLRTSHLFIDLLHSRPTDLTLGSATEIRTAVALAPLSWRKRAEDSFLMLNLPSNRP